MAITRWGFGPWSIIPSPAPQDPPACHARRRLQGKLPIRPGASSDHHLTSSLARRTSLCLSELCYRAGCPAVSHRRDLLSLSPLAPGGAPSACSPTALPKRPRTLLVGLGLAAWVRPVGLRFALTAHLSLSWSQRLANVVPSIAYRPDRLLARRVFGFTRAYAQPSNRSRPSHTVCATSTAQGSATALDKRRSAVRSGIASA